MAGDGQSGRTDKSDKVDNNSLTDFLTTDVYTLTMNYEMYSRKPPAIHRLIVNPRKFTKALITENIKKNFMSYTKYGIYFNEVSIPNTCETVGPYRTEHDSSVPQTKMDIRLPILESCEDPQKKPTHSSDGVRN